MLGRLVNVQTGYQTVSAVQDLLEIKMGSGQAGYVIGWKVMQSSEEQAGDAEALQLNGKRARGAFTAGSSGAAATVVKHQSGDAAHGLATANRNNTTQAAAGSGTLEIIDPDVLNVLAGTAPNDKGPETMIPLGPSEAFILSLDENPTDAITMNAIVLLLITHG